MDINRIAEDFSAAPQITPDDVAEAARAGFRTIICNRPDDEVPDQPQAADVAAAAKAAGLEFRHIPFSGGNLTPETVAAFEAALADCPGPVLAYCRSGTRSTMCWGLA
ncbi:MAG: TIGR01244 family sulfur transferase, partial [Paracoccaceae bacterium]